MSRQTSRFVVPGQRLRIGTLVRREQVRKDSRPWILALTRSMKRLSCRLFKPATECNQCADKQRQYFLSLPHLYVCASRGGSDCSLHSPYYTASALRRIPCTCDVLYITCAACITASLTSSPKTADVCRNVLAHR